MQILTCVECGDITTSYRCKMCDKEIKDRCQECHDELVHGHIAFNTGASVCGGNITPYGSEDAQYFPGISDKFNNQ